MPAQDHRPYLFIYSRNKTPLVDLTLEADTILNLLFVTFKPFHEEYANGVEDKHIKLLSKCGSLKIYVASSYFHYTKMTTHDLGYLSKFIKIQGGPIHILILLIAFCFKNSCSL